MFAMAEIISPTDCQQILENYSSDRKKLIGFEVNRLSEKTLGFLGEHLDLKIRYKSSDDENEGAKQLNLFVKCLPRTNRNHREYVQQLPVFEKEEFFYKPYCQNCQNYPTQKLLLSVI